MKKNRDRMLKTIAVGSLLALPFGVAQALPLVGVGINGAGVGNLAVEIMGQSGALTVDGQLTFGGDLDVSALEGLVPGGTLPGLPADPAGELAGLIPSGGGAPSLPGLPGTPAAPGVPDMPGLPELPMDLPGGDAPQVPALPVDALGTVTGLIPAGGAPEVPALPVDALGTVTGLIPAGGAPEVPALPVDALGTVSGLVPAGGMPELPAAPADPLAAVTGLLPLDAVPLPLP